MHHVINYVGKAIQNRDVVSFITNHDGQVPQNIVKRCESIMKRHGKDVDLIGGQVSVEGQRVMLKLVSKEKFIPKMVIAGGVR